jgi:hypothetical protein
MENHELENVLRGCWKYVEAGIEQLEYSLDETSYGPARKAISDEIDEAKQLLRRVSALIEHAR